MNRRRERADGELLMLTIGEVADLIGINVETLRALLRRRNNPAPLRPASVSPEVSRGKP